MIKALAALFVFGFIFGCINGSLGAALISLAMVPLMLIGERKLNERDREYAALPESAKQPPDALEELRRHDSESAASRF